MKSTFPDFGALPWQRPKLSYGAGAPVDRDTAEGIPIKNAYNAGDVADLGLPRHLAWASTLRSRPIPDDVHRPAVDDPPVRRVLHG